jgi:D-alanyl-D-alanine carboxypeptidase
MMLFFDTPCFKPRFFALFFGLALASLAVFGSPNPVEAKPQFSAISLDARTGKILFSNDIDGLRHPASLTKVMTLYLLFQDLQAKRIKLSTNLLVSRRASNMAPSKLGLKPGTGITVETAIKALITRSANDVAATIGENLGGSEANFAARMTRTARAIGMSKTTFQNASGLPNPNQWTTARDMATLSLRIQRDFPQYYPYFRIASFVYKGEVIRTHNRLLGRYQGTDGIKTGYIAASGFNLTTSAKRGDKRVVGVVLGAASNGSRNRFMMRMLDGAFPKCVDGNTIAAKAGSSEGIMNPGAPPVEMAIIKPKQKSIFGKNVEEPGAEASVEPEVVAEVPAAQGTTFKTVVANAETPSIEETKVLEAKIDDASDGTTEEPDDAVADATPELPAKLPFAVKKGADTIATTPAAEVEVVAAIDPTWNIQIGAFPKKEEARQKIMQIKTSGFHFLKDKPALTVEVLKGADTVYRARFSGFTQKSAKSACAQLSKKGMECMPIQPQS